MVNVEFSSAANLSISSLSPFVYRNLSITFFLFLLSNFVKPIQNRSFFYPESSDILLKIINFHLLVYLDFKIFSFNFSFSLLIYKSLFSIEITLTEPAFGFNFLLFSQIFYTICLNAFPLPPFYFIKSFIYLLKFFLDNIFFFTNAWYLFLIKQAQKFK